MKKDEIPQDNGALNNITKELTYAVDNNGNYTSVLSSGWEVKTAALDLAWQDIEERIEAAKQKVLKKEASPILYFIELRLMDLPTIAGYTGFWQWSIKQHLKPNGFKKLSDQKLKKYAEAFNISLEELKTMNVKEHGI